MLWYGRCIFSGCHSTISLAKHQPTSSNRQTQTSKHQRRDWLPWYFHRKTSATLWDRCPWPWHGQHHITQVPPIFIHLFGGHGSRLPSFPESWWVSSRLVVMWMFLVDTHWWPIWIGQEVTLLLQRLKTIDDLSNDQDANQIDNDGATFSKENQGSSQEISRTYQQKSHLHTHIHLPFFLPCKVSGPKQSHQVQVWMAWNHSAVQRQLCSKLNLKVAEDLPCVFAGVVLKNKKVMSSSLVFRSWHKIKFIRKFLYQAGSSYFEPSELLQLYNGTLLKVHESKRRLKELIYRAQSGGDNTAKRASFAGRFKSLGNGERPPSLPRDKCRICKFNNLW